MFIIWLTLSFLAPNRWLCSPLSYKQRAYCRNSICSFLLVPTCGDSLYWDYMGQICVLRSLGPVVSKERFGVQP